MIKGIAARTGVAVIAIFCWSGLAHAGEINWDKYMRSAANVSAIAAALAMVDNCSKPIKISETKDGAKLRLMFNCDGSEDEEAASIVEFDVFGDAIVPRRFDFAG